jgi:hypothetical protein
MKQVGSISLIIILLVSTFGITVNKHYCGGHLSDVSLYLSATCGCGDMDMDSDCCQTNSDFVQLDEDYTILTFDLSPDNELIVEIANNYVDLLIESDNAPTDYFHHIPPLIERDIPVLVQSFLI